MWVLSARRDPAESIRVLGQTEASSASYLNRVGSTGPGPQQGPESLRMVYFLSIVRFLQTRVFTKEELNT